jgi:hypothetical protein
MYPFPPRSPSDIDIREWILDTIYLTGFILAIGRARVLQWPFRTHIRRASVETRLSLTIVLQEDNLYGKVQVFASQWHGTELIRHSKPVDLDTPIAPYDRDKSVYPWAIAVVKDAADRAAGDLLAKIERGEEMLMKEVVTDKTS